MLVIHLIHGAPFQPSRVLLHLFWFCSELASEWDVDPSPVIYGPLEEGLVCAAISLDWLLNDTIVTIQEKKHTSVIQEISKIVNIFFFFFYKSVVCTRKNCKSIDSPLNEMAIKSILAQSYMFLC